MTRLSQLLAWFPGFTLGAATLSSFHSVWCHQPWGFVLGLFFLYGFPVLMHQLHQRLSPIQSGITYLQGQDYSPWWGSHQFQVIYIAFPALETSLRLVPGLFSAWLRLWGAHIGKQVYWPPTLEIADRGLLSIGEGVVFGHRVGLYSHIIKPRRDNLMLYVKPITIGSGSFIGAGSALGPGVTLAAGSFLLADSKLYPNQTVEDPQREDREHIHHALAD